MFSNLVANPKVGGGSFQIRIQNNQNQNTDYLTRVLFSEFVKNL